MTTIGLIRQELVESGQASQTLLDYIDDCIEQTLANLLTNLQGDLEETLLDKLKDQ